VNKGLGAIILGLFLGLASCSNGSSSSAELLDDEIIVIINGKEITLKQFKKEFAVHKKKLRINTNKEITQDELTWLKNRVIEQIVRNSLLRQEVERNGVQVSQEELDEALFKSETGYTEDTFDRQLAFEGTTREEWKDAIENNLLINKLISNLVNSKVSVSESEMHRYFEANESKFHKKEQVRALHIMVETEEEVRTIQKELRSKQKDFSVLAKEFSLGPEGVRGGDLGYFEAGQMPEEFDNVFKLETNSVSDIIRTPYGFHLFKVVDKVNERKMSFDESKVNVEKILLEELQDVAFQRWMVQLKEKSKIEIRYEYLEKIK
jgi:parvulin-like peptidyl-prolyl isomerase